MSRAELLFKDVEELSQKGVRSLLLTRNDSSNKVKRYLLRNKRKIAVKMVGAIIVGVLAPPALLAYIGGAIVGYGVSRVRKWVAIHNAQSRIDASGGLGEKAMIGGQSDYLTVNAQTFAVNSSMFGDTTLFQDLALIVRRQKLTDIFNSFSEMEKDYLQLNTDFELMKAGGIRNCDHAIRLWEGHFRYHARYLDVKRDFEELDSAVVMAVINLSGLDDEFKTKFSTLLTRSTAGLDATATDTLVQDAANHGTVFGHWNQRRQDRSAQIKSALQLATEGSGLDLTAPLKAAGGKLAGYVISTGVGAAVSATASAGLQAMGHKAMPLGLGMVSLSGGAASASVGGIVGAAEALVINPVVEGLNSAHNERQHQTDQHGLVFKRLETKRERIGKIRPLAKEHFEKWAEKLVHLNTQHNAMQTKYRDASGIFNAADKRMEAAVDYLRWVKLRAQVQEHMKYIGEFQALIVAFTIDMDAFGEEHLSHIESTIRKYVDQDHQHHGHCTFTAGSGICYGPLDQELLRLAALMDREDEAEIKHAVMSQRKTFSETPTCPLRPHDGGKYVYEEYLARYYIS